MARLEARDNHTDAAILHYQRALEDLPARVTALHLEFAAYLDTKKRYEAEVELLEPLIADSSASVDARFLLTGALLALQRTEAAERHLEGLRQLAPSHQGIPVLEAVLARQSGRFRESEDKLRAHLSREPENRRVRYQLGLTLAAAGDWRGALEEMETAAAGAEDPLAVQLDMARIRLEHGQTRQAIRDLKTLAHSERDPAPLLLLADAHARAGDTEAALRTCGELIDAHPDFAAGYTSRARLLTRAGKPAEALDLARRSTLRFPDDASTWATYAELLDRSGQTQAATLALEAGLQESGASRTLLFQLAALHHRLGRSAAAEVLYRRILEQDPDHVLSLNNLAMLLSSDPASRPESLRLAERAYALAPRSAAIQDTTGWIRHLMGDHAGAEKLLRAAMEQLPDDAGVRCHIGSTYVSLGRKEEARSVLRRCVEDSPEEAMRRHAEVLLGDL